MPNWVVPFVLKEQPALGFFSPSSLSALGESSLPTAFSRLALYIQERGGIGRILLLHNLPLRSDTGSWVRAHHFCLSD